MWPFSSAYPEHQPHEADGKTFDYVIVGGGTAGCVLASRLSEDPNVSVLMIDRGIVDDSWLSRNPILSMDFVNSTPTAAVVDRRSVAVAGRSGYKLQLVSGNAVGGSSRVNAMLVTRGMPGIYNEWAEKMGLKEWAWDKVEPFFRSIENATSSPDDPSRGHSGPFKSRIVQEPYKWMSYMEKPCQAVGLPLSQDVNSAKAPAAGYFTMESAIDPRGQRISAMSAFLNKEIAIQRMDRLMVVSGTVAVRLELDAKKGIATGVYIQPQVHKPGESVSFVKARREIILCGGTFGSAQTLLLSGVGPKEELKRHDIPQVAELPVGRHLQDHTSVAVMLEVPWTETVLGMTKIWIGLWNFILCLIWGTGMLCASTSPRSVFFKSSSVDDNCNIKAKEADGTDNMDSLKPQNIPDVEIMMVPCSSIDRWVKDASVVNLLTCLTRPVSESYIELASLDPREHPRVHYPYFTNKADLVTMRTAVRVSMRIATEFVENSDYPYPTRLFLAPTVNKEIEEADSTLKGEDADLKRAAKAATWSTAPRYEVEKRWDQITDDEIDRYVLALGITSLHFSCTCRMSNDPKQGVVDEKLRVHGFKNLRIADCSAFPTIPATHTMLPSMMMGARCADFIKKEWDTRGQEK